MHFLNHSSGYNAEKVLSLLDDCEDIIIFHFSVRISYFLDLLEEKAIVYGRMKEHEKVGLCVFNGKFMIFILGAVDLCQYSNGL